MMPLRGRLLRRSVLKGFRHPIFTDIIRGHRHRLNGGRGTCFNGRRL